MGLFSSIFGSGSKSAYDTSGVAAATASSNELYKKIYEDSLAANAPYQQAGESALGMLTDRLGTSGNTGADGYGSLLKPYTIDSLYNDPSYQFRLQEGEKAIQRGAAAGGSLNSPQTQKALMAHGQGLASDEYMNAFNRNQAGNASIYDMLSGVSGGGQQAVNNVSDAGTMYAAAKSGNDMNLAQAVLGSYQAKNAATQGAWNTLIGAGTRLGAGWLGGV